MLAKASATLENVRFEQSLFTLPFAYLGMVLAAKGLPSAAQFLWITAAMVGARTYGMSMNRLVDLQLDKSHPRAKERPLPSGRLTVREVVAVAGAGIALTLVAAANLNPLCLALSPVAVGCFTAYSFIKRFSWLTHLALGICLGGAPVGGWIAVTGQMSWEALLLGLVVMTWAAGFDTLYACGDVEEDRALGVKTIPVRFGVKTALTVSTALHLLTITLLAVTGVAFQLAWPYWAGVTVAAALLLYEHSLVRPQDLSKLNTAFFTVNGLISVLVFAAAFASLYL